MTTENNLITVYACGGAGVNIGRYVDQQEAEVNPNFAELKVVYIDTSRSNMRGRFDGKNVYIINQNNDEAIDGSGQVRREHAQDIIAQVPAILHEHKPSICNIVISSASGGSGSVLSPSIVSELLKRGENVIVMTIGCRDTEKYAQNTLDTLKSFEGVSKVTGRPVVLYYEENTEEKPREKVDAHIRGTIAMIQALFSKSNEELDSKDLTNWLNYDKVTSYSPRLTALEVLDKDYEADPNRNYISLATLTAMGQKTAVKGLIPEYQCIGFVSNTTSDAVMERLPIHIVVTEDGLTQRVRSLQKFLDELRERKGARSSIAPILTDDDELSTDNGLVL